jgi:hypothetical protein
MTGRNAVPEASVIFNQLAGLIAWEYFISFSRREVFRSCIIIATSSGLVYTGLISDWTVSSKMYRKDLNFTKNEGEAFVLPRDSITPPGRITFSVIFLISVSQFEPIPCVHSLHPTFIPLFSLLLLLQASIGSSSTSYLWFSLFSLSILPLKGIKHTFDIATTWRYKDYYNYDTI